jgi:hypothetical protein
MDGSTGWDGIAEGIPLFERFFEDLLLPFFYEKLVDDAFDDLRELIDPLPLTPKAV